MASKQIQRKIGNPKKHTQKNGYEREGTAGKLIKISKMGAAISGLVFQPPKTTPLNAERRERLWLTTAHGINIPAFFIDRNAPLTVLFSHGNAEDLGMIYDWFKSFSAVLQVNVLAYDYTGRISRDL
jgi:hypothetical protein